MTTPDEARKLAQILKEISPKTADGTPSWGETSAAALLSLADQVEYLRQDRVTSRTATGSLWLENETLKKELAEARAEIDRINSSADYWCRKVGEAKAERDAAKEVAVNYLMLWHRIERHVDIGRSFQERIEHDIAARLAEKRGRNDGPTLLYAE